MGIKLKKNNNKKKPFVSFWLSTFPMSEYWSEGFIVEEKLQLVHLCAS